MQEGVLHCEMGGSRAAIDRACECSAVVCLRECIGSALRLETVVNWQCASSLQLSASASTVQCSASAVQCSAVQCQSDVVAPTRAHQEQSIKEPPLCAGIWPEIRPIWPPDY